MKRETPEPALERVLHFIQRHKLIKPSEPLLVAVSGGPDSVCLLHILLGLRDKPGIELHIAHLNHQLRGAESEADARYVTELAHQLGIPSTVEKRDVKSYRTERRLSLEEAAREVRYTFLTEVARAIGASRVAVGHTADDHIETILMHLIRGSGTRGLRGLQPRTEWRFQGKTMSIIRPLLSTSRAETTGYCQQHQLKPCLDTSNLSLSPLRNRIRLELLPLMQSYNPQVSKALVRMAQIAGDDLDFINEESQQVWLQIAREQGNTIILDKERLISLPLALKRHLLRIALEKLAGNLRDIETRHIEQLITALGKPAGREISLPYGITFIIEYDRYLLSTDPDSLSPSPFIEGEFSLNIPGETTIPGWRVEATIIPREQAAKEDDLTAHFDRDKTGDNLTIRSRKRGDRFQPLGMNQPKKVGEFMIDSRIPRAWRQRIPIVCSPGQILWVVGWRIDERVKVTETTKLVLRLKMAKTETT